MGWLKRLFGYGKLRVEFETLDNRHGTATTAFEGAWDSEADIAEELVNLIWVDHGVRVSRLRIVGAYGHGSTSPLTGEWFEVK